MKSVCKDGYCVCTGQDYNYHTCLRKLFLMATTNQVLLVMYAIRFPPSIIMCASFWCVFTGPPFLNVVVFEICYRKVKVKLQEYFTLLRGNITCISQ